MDNMVSQAGEGQSVVLSPGLWGQPLSHLTWMDTAMHGMGSLGHAADGGLKFELCLFIIGGNSS